MLINLDKLPKSQVKISLTAEPDEFKSDLQKAARQISEVKKIPGFRPGKASVGLVKNTVGADALMQEVAQLALPRLLSKAIKEQKLAVIGKPHYDVENLKFGETLKFTAVLSVLPTVKLGDFKSKKIKAESIVVTNEKVAAALREMQKMRRSEALVIREARDGDKIEVSLEISQAGQVLDRQDKMPVVLGDQRFIKGFETALAGLKKGDEKEFDLKFPGEYYNKDLAGHKAHFKVKVLSVYELKIPALNDDLAKAVGNFDNVDQLRHHIRHNLELEAKKLEQSRVENEIIKRLVEQADFGEIPELMVNQETQRLMREINQSLVGQGLKMEEHLERLGKKESELMLELTPKALERARTSLALRQLVQDEGIVVEKAEYERELEKLKSTHQDAPDMLKQIDSAQHKEYLASQLLYQKAINFLKRAVLDK